jgi:hypothetical protein
MMKRLLYVIGFSASVFGLVSCSGGNNNEQKEQEVKEDLQTFVEREFDYPIPTSYEVTRMLQKANASFVYNITNDPEKVDEYVTEWQKAMNLGVYGADLSYASTFNKNEETVEFMNASRTLIEDLNISTAFNQSFANRIEANLENKDSLILIITESFQDTYNYLNRNGEEKTSLLVIAGSVIEGLHITSQLIISSDYNEDLLQVLAEQKDEVNDLVTLMDAHSDDENVNRVLPTLRYINLFYEQLGPDNGITRGQFEDIYSSIQDMRATVVN